MNDFEHARALLSAVIAAYSALVGEATSREVTRALHAERAPLLHDREKLTADDRDRVAEIIREMPGRLAAVRAGGSSG
ncbi:hypothetical protein ACFWR9_14875 [Streptomyces sp. NPDC058534]|uniref:hypothetical protein n=1 Tax=Streptomyces sp. NPDC058534 TaxID=3346541 RepID=UPI003646F494